MLNFKIIFLTKLIQKTSIIIFFYYYYLYIFNIFIKKTGAKKLINIIKKV